MRRQRGAIIKRGRVYYIKYRDPQGKQRWESGFKTRAKAQDRLNKILGEINEGSYLEPRAVTFEKFAEEWIESRLRIRGSTEAAYRSLIRTQLIPALGKLRVGDIRPEHVQKLVRSMSEHSVKTIHNCATLLRTMLVGARGPSAMRLGYIRHDPTLGLELPQKETGKIIPPTQEEVWHLIDAAKKTGGIGYPIVYTDAFTGLRRNEILALRYTDIDWLNQEIFVCHAISKTKADDDVHKWAWRIGAPKSKKSIRRVAVTESVLRLLADLRRLAADSQGLVFTAQMAGVAEGPQASERFIDPDYFNASIFAPIAKRAGLTQLRFHDLRHFFASMLIAQRESPEYIRDQLGHSSIQVTFDIYGHLFPQARPEAAAKLEKAMMKARKKSKRIGSILVANDRAERTRKPRESAPN